MLRSAQSLKNKHGIGEVSELFSVDEVALQLEVSSATVRNWTKAGLIRPCSGMEKKIVYDRSCVDQLKQSIASGELSKLQRRANKIASSQRAGMKRAQELSEGLDQVFTQLEAGQDDRRMLLIAAAQLIRFSRRFGVNYVEFLTAKNSVAKVFNEIIADFLVPLDIVELLDSMDESAIHAFCQGDYLGLLTTGQLSKSGAFYTPDAIARQMIEDHLVFASTSVLDPCCGSGAFLVQAVQRLKSLGVSSWNDKVFGFEIDRASALCAKLNLLYEMDDECAAVPHIFCGDALDDALWKIVPSVDLIVSNPPWGIKFKPARLKELKAKLSLDSSESFSLFMAQALKHVHEGAVVSYLAPVSILNVKAHLPVRKLLLKKQILEIRCIGRAFENVFTKAVQISVRKAPSIQKNLVSVSTEHKSYAVKQENLTIDKGLAIVPERDPKTTELLCHMQNIGGPFLSKASEWALGVVTGNNSRFLKEEKDAEDVQLIRGRDISPFKIESPSLFMKFEPEKFQQVAADRFYFAKKKLVYKFISKRLCFAVDDQKRVPLNSANILLPGSVYPIEVVCALLNSTPVQYYYEFAFSALKVLRSNIEAIPLPKFTDEQMKRAVELANPLFETEGDSFKNALEVFDDFVADCYEFSTEQKDLVSNWAFS